MLLTDADEKIKYSSTLNFTAPDARQNKGSKYGRIQRWEMSCRCSENEWIWRGVRFVEIRCKMRSENTVVAQHC